MYSRMREPAQQAAAPCQLPVTSADGADSGDTDITLEQRALIHANREAALARRTAVRKARLVQSRVRSLVDSTQSDSMRRLRMDVLDQQNTRHVRALDGRGSQPAQPQQQATIPRSPPPYLPPPPLPSDIIPQRLSSLNLSHPSTESSLNDIIPQQQFPKIPALPQ